MVQLSPLSAKAIVADDREDIREMVTYILIRKLGFPPENITQAVNGEQVLQLIGEEGPFDLLITDNDMETALTGINLIGQLKRSPPPGAPSVMILFSGIGTGAEAERIRQQVMGFGATEVVSKSAGTDTIIRLFAKAIGLDI